MTLYHINPMTGMPGVCHAKKGHCPYAPAYEHFSSYESAQEAADQIAASRFVDYKKAEDYDDKNISWDAISKFNYLNKMTKPEALKEIRDTADVDLLRDVINRNVLTNVPDGDTDYIDEALRNDNIPVDLMDSIQQHPQDYTHHALLAFEDNENLSSAEKVELMNGDLSDNVFCQSVATNKNIQGPAIREILDDLKGSNEGKWPKKAALLVYNKNCPKDVFDEWTLGPLFSKYALS